MIFIGTLFCNLLEDAMRLHLQPRAACPDLCWAAHDILGCRHSRDKERGRLNKTSPDIPKELVFPLPMSPPHESRLGTEIGMVSLCRQETRRLFFLRSESSALSCSHGQHRVGRWRRWVCESAACEGQRLRRVLGMDSSLRCY